MKNWPIIVFNVHHDDVFQLNWKDTTNNTMSLLFSKATFVNNKPDMDIMISLDPSKARRAFETNR